MQVISDCYEIAHAMGKVVKYGRETLGRTALPRYFCRTVAAGAFFGALGLGVKATSSIAQYIMYDACAPRFHQCESRFAKHPEAWEDCMIRTQARHVHCLKGSDPNNTAAILAMQTAACAILGASALTTAAVLLYRKASRIRIKSSAYNV